MRPEVADVKYIGKTVFQHQSVRGLCMPSLNFGWGEGLNTPAPLLRCLLCQRCLSAKLTSVGAYGYFFTGIFFGCVNRNFQKFKSKGTEKGA